MVVVSSVLNVLGGTAFGRIGRVQPGHARSAVRRLLRVGRQVRTGRLDIEDSVSSGQAADLRAALLRLDVRLDDLEGVLKDAIADWNDVHGEALRKVLEGEADV